MSHEPQHLASGRLALLGAVLGGATVVILIVCFFLWRSWSASTVQPANYPGSPRLQPMPARDLASFRRAQQNEEIWGWADREHGVARIPVKRAMRLMAKEPSR